MPTFSQGQFNIKLDTDTMPAISPVDEYNEFEKLNDEISKSIAALKDLSMKSNMIEGVSESESAKRSLLHSDSRLSKVTPKSNLRSGLNSGFKLSGSHTKDSAKKAAGKAKMNKK